MTEAEIVAIIVATPPTVVSFVAAWLGWLNRTRLGEVKKNVDGNLADMTAELKAATAAILEANQNASRREGELIGRDHELGRGKTQ